MRPSQHPARRAALPRDALHRVASSDDVDVLEALIEVGSDLEACNERLTEI
jgi:hypothetical protein